jgi:VanZ family protein
LSRHRFSLWAPVALYMALIFGISSVSQPIELPEGVTDKGGHAILYAGLGALVARALVGGWRQPVTTRVWLVTVAVCVVYGITDEIHQHFVPPREADVLDVMADGAGAAVAAGVLRLLRRPT